MSNGRRRKGLGRVRHFYGNEELTITNASGDSWTGALKTELKVKVPGEYRISWNFVWGGSSTKRKVNVRVLLNDKVIGYMSSPPKKSSWKYVELTDTRVMDYAEVCSGFFYVDLTVGESPTISIEVQSEHKRYYAYVSMIRLEIE